MEASARDGRMAASYKPAGEVARGPPDQYFSITFSFSCSLPTCSSVTLLKSLYSGFI